MPLLTTILKPQQFNSVELADRLLHQLNMPDPPEDLQRTVIDAIQVVLDQMKEEGILA